MRKKIKEKEEFHFLRRIYVNRQSDIGGAPKANL